jgi:hypothetical protein
MHRREILPGRGPDQHSTFRSSSVRSSWPPASLHARTLP